MIDPVTALLEAKRFNNDADQLFMLYRDALGATRAEYKRYSKFDPDIYIEYQSEGRANAPSTVREYLAR